MSLHGASSGDAGALACFGVFDGHGGVEAAQYASQCLLARVADEVTNDEGEPPSDKLIASAFASVDDEVWAQPGHCSGTTAVCAFAGARSRARFVRAPRAKSESAARARALHPPFPHIPPFARPRSRRRARGRWQRARRLRGRG